MNPEIIITVVVPCFNDGKYLSEALESVYAQSMDAWEIIIVDDGSTDHATLQVLDSLNDSRIRVLRADHKGPAAARNLAISRARGHYILPLDADDKVASTYLEQAKNVLVSMPEVEITYCQAQLFGLVRGKWKLPSYNPELFVLQNMIFSTAMFRRKTWESVGGYSENMLYGMEDYDFWIKLLSRGGAVYRIEEPLFFYRVRGHSRTASLKKNKRKMEWQSYITLFENNITFFTRPENTRIIFRELRKSWVWQNKIHSSFLWRYCFRYLVDAEVMFQQFLKRLLGRA